MPLVRKWLDDASLARWLFFLEPSPKRGSVVVASGRSWFWDEDNEEWWCNQEISHEEWTAQKNMRVMSYEEVMEIGRQARKTEALMPSDRDIEDAFGSTAAETGRVNLDLASRDGKRNRSRLLDMMQPVWRRQAEVAARKAG